jgi:hypothetical protein
VPGQGGEGLSSVIIDGSEYDFATVFGNAYTSISTLEDDKRRYISGGGGGGGYCWNSATPSCWQGEVVSGGKGGGGRGINGVSTDGDCTDGKNNTGSGGGGAKGDGALSCAGGSGLILLAFLNASSGSDLTRTVSGGISTTPSASNLNTGAAGDLTEVF